MRNRKTVLFCILFYLLGGLPVLASPHSTERQAAVYESYALERKADYTGAIKKLTKHYAGDENDYFLNYRLGWLFYLAKKYKNSIDHFEKAAQLSSGSLEPVLGLSLLYLTIGDFNKTLDASERVLKKDPKNYYGLLRSILAKIKLNQNSSALGQVNEALLLYPTDVVFLEQKGFILMQQKKVEEAKHVLTFLLLLSPSNAYAKSILLPAKE